MDGKFGYICNVFFRVFWFVRNDIDLYGRRLFGGYVENIFL